jgi:hypothetical protein
MLLRKLFDCYNPLIIVQRLQGLQDQSGPMRPFAGLWPYNNPRCLGISLSDNSHSTRLSVPMFPFHKVSPFLFPDLSCSYLAYLIS